MSVAVLRPPAVCRAQVAVRRKVEGRRCVYAKASSSPDPDAGPTMMSLEEAEKILQVVHGADFDTILRAKDKLLSKTKDDEARKFEVRVVVRDR